MGEGRHSDQASRATRDAQGAVVVLSPLQLISHTVAAALRSRGLDAQAMSWMPGVRRAIHQMTGEDMVLLLDDLEDRDSVLAARDLVKQSAARVLVLTRCTEGPAWGGLLASGAVGLMPVESSLDDVATVVALARRGEAVIAGARQSQLEHEWFTWLAEDTRLRLCVELLPGHDDALVNPPGGTDGEQGPVVPRPRQQERGNVRH